MQMTRDEMWQEYSKMTAVNLTEKLLARQRLLEAAEIYPPTIVMISIEIDVILEILRDINDENM